MGTYFGYSETTGGYAGDQAGYPRVPYANFTSFKVPEGSEPEDEERLPILPMRCVPDIGVQIMPELNPVIR